MTSEIVIMNRNAIAMAADSAVTFGNRKTRKTYNGVNKLFMLSNDPPMGIMIFGSADFENIPLETLIKEYRKKTDFKQIKNISNIKKDFLEYLGRVTPNSDIQYILQHIESFREVINQKYSEETEEDFIDFISQYKEEEIFPFLDNDIFDLKFEEINNIFKEKLKSKINVNLLKKCFSTELSSLSANIVISGFNEEDMFPSLIEFSLVMKFKGKIIYKDNIQEINYSGNAIFPFAQNDVIRTFLSGIDNNLEFMIIKYFDNFINSYLSELERGIKSNRKINGKDLNNILKEIKKIKSTNINCVEKYMKNIDEMKKSIYSPVLKSIGALPKDELANMSESLIHITSLKRKIDSDLETVGGDIDVAIISKGDGFIWKKHKHYFESELNPQFFKDKE